MTKRYTGYTDVSAAAADLEPRFAALQRQIKYFSVQDTQFHGGAKGDRVTDDLLAFEACATAAKAAGAIMFIPPLAGGYYYKLSEAWVISSFINLTIYGGGVRSLLVAANAVGQNAITLDACTHALIHGIGLSGLDGSGHGIEIANDSHWPVISKVTAAWMGGNAFHLSGGIDARFDHCDAQQDEGYDPAGLGFARGNNAIGFCVPSNPHGHNNNAQMIGCISEGCKDYALKVGDSTDLVLSFAWIGGLLEGTQSRKDAYLRCTNGKILDAHIESTSVSATEYSVTLDRCINTRVVGGIISNDVQLLGCGNTGLSFVQASGVLIDASSVDCHVRDALVANNPGGPAAGKIIDLGVNTDLARLRIGNTGYGYWPNAVRTSKTTGRSWNGTAMPGWTATGATLSQVIDGSGNAAIRMQIAGAGFVQFVRKVLDPIEAMRGKWVTVDCVVTVADDTKGLRLFGTYDGGSTVSFSSATEGVKERICAAFFIPLATVAFLVDLTGIDGADISLHSIAISITDFAPATVQALGATATPDLQAKGYMVPSYTDAGSGTAITGFTGAVEGVEFSIAFTGARTIVHSATMILSGTADFVAKSGDTITLKYWPDGKFREAGRMVS